MLQVRCWRLGIGSRDALTQLSILVDEVTTTTTVYMSIYDYGCDYYPITIILIIWVVAFCLQDHSSSGSEFMASLGMYNFYGSWSTCTLRSS
jgi:hypothetical protein